MSSQRIMNSTQKIWFKKANMKKSNAVLLLLG